MPYPYDAKSELIQAVLRVLTSQQDTSLHAYSDAEAEYADDWMEAAARNFVAEVDAYNAKKE